MNALISAFPVQLLFRGIVPGAFFILSIIATSEGTDGLRQALIEGKVSAAMLITAGVLSGVVMYTLHRALVYPWIELGLTWRDDPKQGRGEIGNKSLITAAACDALLDHWTVGTLSKSTPKQGIEAGSVFQIVGEHNSTWNNYVHLQYASAVCTVVGAIVGLIWKQENICNWEWKWIVTVGAVAFVLLLAAITGDVRRRAVMTRFLGTDIPAPSKTV